MTSEGPHETIIPLVEEGKDSKTIPSSSNDDFALAHSESLGFFPDIAENDWRRIKAKTRSMQPERVAKAGKIEMGCWFQNHFEPDFACRHERRIGKRGDGGKWTCDPHLIQEQKRCLVYSIGSNGDPTFEQAVLEEIGLVVTVRYIRLILTISPTLSKEQAQPIINGVSATRLAQCRTPRGGERLLK